MTELHLICHLYQNYFSLRKTDCSELSTCLQRFSIMRKANLLKEIETYVMTEDATWWCLYHLITSSGLSRKLALCFTLRWSLEPEACLHLCIKCYVCRYCHTLNTFRPFPITRFVDRDKFKKLFNRTFPPSNSMLYQNVMEPTLWPKQCAKSAHSKASQWNSYFRAEAFIRSRAVLRRET